MFIPQRCFRWPESLTSELASLEADALLSELVSLSALEELEEAELSVSEEAEEVPERLLSVTREETFCRSIAAWLSSTPSTEAACSFT